MDAQDAFIAHLAVTGAPLLLRLGGEDFDTLTAVWSAVWTADGKLGVAADFGDSSAQWPSRDLGAVTVTTFSQARRVHLRITGTDGKTADHFARSVTAAEDGSLLLDSATSPGVFAAGTWTRLHANATDPCPF